MKQMLLFSIVVLFISCNGQQEKTILQKNAGEIQKEKKLTKLEGKYDAKQNAWLNLDKLYTAVIQFDDDQYASFSKIDKDENSLGMGLLDKTGKVIVQPDYSGIMVGFTNGFCVVSSKDGKQGLVNESGVEIAKPIYDDILYTNEFAEIDKNMIRVTKDDQTGFINRNGSFVVALQKNPLILVGKDRIMYMTEPAKWGLMDYKSKRLTPPVFTSTNFFENGKMNLQKEDGENYTVYLDGKTVKN